MAKIELLPNKDFDSKGNFVPHHAERRVTGANWTKTKEYNNNHRQKYRCNLSTNDEDADY